MATKQELMEKYAAGTELDAKELEDTKFDSLYFKLKDGKNYARVLPASDGGNPIIRVEKHFVETRGGKSFGFNCPRQHKERCPLCDYAWAARDRGDEETFYTYKASTQFAMHAIDRNADNPKALVLVFGRKTYLEKVQPALEQQKDDEENVFDLFSGHDMVITRSPAGPGERFPTTSVTFSSKRSEAVEDVEALSALMEGLPSLETLKLAPTDIGEILAKVDGISYDPSTMLVTSEVIDCEAMDADFSDEAKMLEAGDALPF